MELLDDVIEVPHGREVDWSAVVESGVRVCFMRATSGPGIEAPSFERARDAALAAGCAVVPYDRLGPEYGAEAAKCFMEIAALDRGTPCMLDWEGRASQVCTPQEAEEVGLAVQHRTHRLPVGHWGVDGLHPTVPTPKMAEWPRSIARYPAPGAQRFTDLPISVQGDPLNWWRGALLAQYTVHGVVPGIQGPVDRWAWLGTLEERDEWLRSGAMPARSAVGPGT